MKKCTKVFSVILAAMMLASLAACGAEKVKITPTAARSIETEVYETADFSITIPKGWVVTTGGENIYHSIRIYDPEEPMNQMFSLLKADVLLHSQAGKKAWQYMASVGSSGASLFAQAAVLGTPSTEGFYQIFPDYTAFVMQVESSYAGYTFPTFNDFTVTEHFPFTSGLSIHALGEELLRDVLNYEGLLHPAAAHALRGGADQRFDIVAGQGRRQAQLAAAVALGALQRPFL